MSAAWLAVLATGAVTIALKGAGPLLLGGRPLPPRLDGVLRLLAPALLAAFVATQTLVAGTSLVVDARLAGVAVAGLLVWRRVPLLVVVVAAAATTALVRLV